MNCSSSGHGQVKIMGKIFVIGRGAARFVAKRFFFCVHLGGGFGDSVVCHFCVLASLVSKHCVFLSFCCSPFPGSVKKWAVSAHKDWGGGGST